MINIEMTVREAVLLANKCDDYGGDEGRNLRDRIIKALESATGNANLIVACRGVNYVGQYWDKKIPAIKSLRLATGWGLKESKEWVENCQHHTKTSQYDVRTYFTPSLEPTLAKKLCKELKNCGMDCWTIDS